MPRHEPLIRNISDTAFWAAAFRAGESERADAVFRDPLARRLCGERGQRAMDRMPTGRKHAWAWVARTWLFDTFIEQRIAAGADAVINLAAGLDARPYRLALPPALRWFEVDLPHVLEYKEKILRGERPRCVLERVPLDLSNVAARRALFERVGGRHVLVITEGILVYLDAGEVAALAADLAAPPGFEHWVTDLASPGVLRMLQKTIGKPLAEAGSPLKFAPAVGPGFFEPLGWPPAEVRPMIQAAARLKRLPFLMRLLALLPQPQGPPGNRPWSGVCLLRRSR